MDSNTSTVMPVSPLYGGGGFGGFGGMGGDWGWIILLLVLFGAGGWGGGFGGADGLYPWLNNCQNIGNGFANAALGDQLTGIQAAINNGTISNLERSFAAQTAATQGTFDLSSQLATCCCENRLATQGLQSVILSENCADRAALNEGVRDIIANQTAGIQRILDVMCSDKIDSKNERIADLERQLQMAALSASQNAQTAQLLYYIAPRPSPEVTPVI